MRDSMLLHVEPIIDPRPAKVSKISLNLTRIREMPIHTITVYAANGPQLCRSSSSILLIYLESYSRHTELD